MKYTNEQIAAALDYAVLKPTTSREQVTKACELAKANHFASICVRPCDIRQAASFGITVSTVIGFPHGGNAVLVKVFEAQHAIYCGAEEIDAVINFAKLLDGDYDYVYQEIQQLRRAVPNNILKIILETGCLSKYQTQLACRICAKVGVDYVKTSTGFNGRGASTVDVIRMREALMGTSVKIKASGGITTNIEVVDYLNLGCTRIGSSKWMELLNE
jgi:deoxyribose-phosphate aldolase